MIAASPLYSGVLAKTSLRMHFFSSLIEVRVQNNSGNAKGHLLIP